MFRASNFVGHKRSPAIYEFLSAHVGGGTTSQVLTLADKPLGTATPDRMIVVLNGGGRGTNVPELSSMTIGGVSATIIQGGFLEGSSWGHGSICYALVPTGTEGDFVWTYDTDEYSNNTGGSYSIKNYLQFDPINDFVIKQNSSPMTGALDVLGGGVALAIAVIREVSQNHVWTGMTEVTAAGGSGTYSTASIPLTVAEAARAIVATDSFGTDPRAFIGASWR